MQKFERKGAVAHVTPSLVIYAPQFFARADFMEWLNQSNAMTWHDRKCDRADENSDTVVLVDPSTLDTDNPDGSDSDMPEDIWQEICALTLEAKNTCGWSDDTHHIAVRLINADD